jgi:hypothetical protein
MEAVYFSDLLNIYQTTRREIRDDSNLNRHRREKLRSYRFHCESRAAWSPHLCHLDQIQTCITAAGLSSLATDYNQSCACADLQTSSILWSAGRTTVTVRVRSQIKSCGICGTQSGTRATFRVLQFPLPSLTPPDASHPSASRGWYNCPTSGLTTKWTQSHPKPRLKKQEVLGRTNRLLCLDATLTTKKKEGREEKAGGGSGRVHLKGGGLLFNRRFCRFPGSARSSFW